MFDRVLLHSDLNNFYASVECLHNPVLRGKPVAVCGDVEARHGIVLAKNYEAKKYGIKTGDVLWEAKQKCPGLISVTANFKLYLRFSQLVRKIYERYTDKIEAFGIDECWLDVTGCGRSGEEIANEIREAIKFECGLTASIGVSYNKIFAKLGSDMKKPDATTVISRENFKDKVWPLPAEDLLYVGRKTKVKLNRFNVFTIGDLANADIKLLKSMLGKWGEYLHIFANGYDTSPVKLNGQADVVKSVGNSTTAMRDLQNTTDVHMMVTVIAESISARLKEQSLAGCIVSLYIRTSALEGWNKQTRLKNPTNISGEIMQAAMQLFKDYSFYSYGSIRAVGISVSDLEPEDTNTQLTLFSDEQKRDKLKKLDTTINNIRRRFGHFAINRAIEYLDKELTHLSPKEENVIHPYSYFKP